MGLTKKHIYKIDLVYGKSVIHDACDKEMPRYVEKLIVWAFIRGAKKMEPVQ